MPLSADAAIARWPLTTEGIWLRAGAARPGAPRAGLFLDRDGVVVEEVGFLRHPADLRLMPGAALLIRRANAAEVPAAVITNQSGIARGFYGWDEFAAVEDEIAKRLAHEGARLDGVCACPFHPEFGAGDAAACARWRKPGPGMIAALGAALNIDLARSWLVGDKASDIAAARNAGLAGALLVLTGHGAASRTAAEALGTADFPVRIAADLDAASRLLAEALFGARP